MSEDVDMLSQIVDLAVRERFVDTVCYWFRAQL